MLLLAILWGLSIPVTKLGLETMPPLVLTLLRFAFALPLLIVVQIGKPGLPRRAVVPVAILGIVGIGVGQVTQTLGVGATSASAGTIISATIPLFVGVALILLSSVAVAIYYVWSVELTAAHGTATVATWSTVAGFVALLPWAA